MKTLEIREGRTVLAKWAVHDYTRIELESLINTMFREARERHVAIQDQNKPKKLYLHTENYSTQELPEQFQGLHSRDNCPIFKGGGCPNCRTREAAVTK